MITKKQYENLKAMQLRVGSDDSFPACFEFEGILLDTGKAIEKLCQFYERDLAKLG